MSQPISYQSKMKQVYHDLDTSQIPTRGELTLNEPCWHCSCLLANTAGSVGRPPFVFYSVRINGFERKLHRRCAESIGFSIPRADKKRRVE